MKRWAMLPAHGQLVVNTDLHGNMEDFIRLREVFERARADDPQAHWVILGDAVHGPSDEARRRLPELYDYEDQSFAIVEELAELRRRHPEHVHFVLGNHDYAHVGGPRVRKFHSDEAGHLESKLSEQQVETMKEFFRESLLLVLTPCGVSMCHGSPDDTIGALEDLDRVPLPPMCIEDKRILASFLFAYGHPQSTTDRFLRLVSRGRWSQHVVVHGHDRDPEGWFAEHGNRVCPVLFGAPESNRRYLVLDLAARYESADDLREGFELRRLYPDDDADGRALG